MTFGTSRQCALRGSVVDEHQVWLHQGRLLWISVPPGITPSKRKLNDWIIYCVGRSEDPGVPPPKHGIFHVNSRLLFQPPVPQLWEKRRRPFDLQRRWNRNASHRERAAEMVRACPNEFWWSRRGEAHHRRRRRLGWAEGFTFARLKVVVCCHGSFRYSCLFWHGTMVHHGPVT